MTENTIQLRISDTGFCGAIPTDPAELAAEAERANAHLQTLAAAQAAAITNLIDATLNAAEAVGSKKYAGPAHVGHAARTLLDDLKAARARFDRSCAAGAPVAA